MFNKERTKGIFTGIALTLILMLSTNLVFAQVANKSISIAFKDIKIFIDDMQITPTDANGNIVEPFIYNGTTYLPVRAVADALGKAVTWDGKSNSVYLGIHDSDTPAIMLNQLDAYNEAGNEYEFDTTKDNLGNVRSDGWYHSSLYSDSVSSKSYMVDGKYRKTTGFFFINNKYPATNGSAILKIIADGNAVYTSPELKAGMDPIRFEADINNASSITYEIHCIEKDELREFGISDIALYQ